MNDVGKGCRPEPDGDLSSAELLRECGRRLTDREFWGEFQKRFQRRIFLYLLRAYRSHRGQSGDRGFVLDWAQEVYLRLVQNDGRILRTFRGTTEFSVKAFLARISASVVADHVRYQAAEKRQAQVISIDQARETIETSRRDRFEAEARAMASMLSWIDVERILQADEDRKNAARNLLIFKLYYIDGFTAAEIAAFPGFHLSKFGIEDVLARLLKRIRG